MKGIAVEPTISNTEIEQQQDAATRKVWQTPGVETLKVNLSESATEGSTDGIGSGDITS
jgi:hypothetical protein